MPIVQVFIAQVAMKIIVSINSSSAVSLPSSSRSCLIIKQDGSLVATESRGQSVTWQRVPRQPFLLLATTHVCLH